MTPQPILVAAAFAARVFAPTAARATDANGNHETYTWVIGATSPSDAAIARDGSTIAMSGRGTLTAGAGNSATGGGTFRMSGGASGTWSATDVLGFVSYGPAGPKFPAGFTGGEAKLDVRLSNGASGVLT